MKYYNLQDTIDALEANFPNTRERLQYLFEEAPKQQTYAEIKLSWSDESYDWRSDEDVDFEEALRKYCGVSEHHDVSLFFWIA